MNQFKPQCRPALIGSLPLTDHQEALDLILKYIDEIPLWPQLPKNIEEGMIHQFLSGLPGFVCESGKDIIQNSSPEFEADMLSFYEDYMMAAEDDAFLLDSRFKLEKDTAKGFFTFLKTAKASADSLVALKGQVTGPITTGIGVTDHDGRFIFYDDTLRDILVKHLAMKAKWQVLKMKAVSENITPIVFFDEPAFVSFGSSAYIGMSREMVFTAFQEVISAVKNAGGLAGIHICANGDWSLALESDTDIVSFDAYAYFDNLILYKDTLIKYLEAGRILAWGIVPTLNSEDIEKENVDSLYNRLEKHIEKLVSFGINRDKILEQSLITPSCGTGSLSLELATKVLSLTKGVSERFRKQLNQ